MRDKVINIAGVVGVGKSSLCNIFNELGYKVYHEPVFDNELLEKFYYNKEKYAFPLQIFFLNKYRTIHMSQILIILIISFKGTRRISEISLF